MGLYREVYKVRDEFPAFEKVKGILDESTGLSCEVKVLHEASAVFLCKKLKSEAQVIIENPGEIHIFFTPRKRKNYFESAFLFSIENYIEGSVVAEEKGRKKWEELGLFEKLF